MRYAVLAVLILASATACARGPSKVDLAFKQIQEETARCPAMPMAAYAKCAGEIEQRVMKPVISRPDLVDVYVATRLALASKVDRGEMRREDADLHLAQTKSQLISEYERMGLARRSVGAQEAAAAPRSVTCMNVGGVVTCN